MAWPEPSPLPWVVAPSVDVLLVPLVVVEDVDVVVVVDDEVDVVDDLGATVVVLPFGSTVTLGAAPLDDPDPAPRGAPGVAAVELGLGLGEAAVPLGAGGAGGLGRFEEVLGFGDGFGAVAGGGAMSGRAPAPNAKPMAVPGAGLYWETPTELYCQDPPRFAW
jgi:hypothetical protein